MILLLVFLSLLLLSLEGVSVSGSGGRAVPEAGAMIALGRVGALV